MNKQKIIIIGMGNIGEIEYNVLNPKFSVDYIDKVKPSSIQGSITFDYESASKAAEKILYDLAVICVPTDLINGDSLDMIEVYTAIYKINAKVYLIKSTLNVGTCDNLVKTTGKRIVHSPEYSGTTQHCNNFEYNFTILGGNKEDCYYVQQIYQEIYDGRHIFEIVDAKTSELVKLMENCWLATKVSFCASFWKNCQELNIPYEDVRKCFVLDPRINPSHTFIYNEHPYWDSHCLNKDVPATAEQLDNNFMKNVIKFNEEMKTNSK